MPAGEGADDADAFAHGVAASAGSGGLAHRLFGVRTAGLFGTLTPTQAPSYLSGLLIGHELRGWLPAEWPPVLLVGRPALAGRYARALALLGTDARIHAEELTASGLFRVATARGLPG